MTFNWANLVIAAFVPFLSAWVAFRLTESAQLKQDARQALLKVRRDMQSFRYAFLKRRHHQQHGSQDPNTDVPLADAVAELDADCFALGLLFGKEASQPVGSRLAELAKTAELLNGPRIPGHEESQAELVRLIQGIADQIRPLWQRVERRSFWKLLKGEL